MNEASTCNTLSADDDPEAVSNNALFWTACFLVTLGYGGAEEGGWWFTEGELVTDPDTYRALGGTPRSFLMECEAQAYAATLEANLPPLNAGRPPKHASTSQGVFEIHVLQAASLPPGFPVARPRYE